MVELLNVFSGYSVNSLAEAKKFYEEVLGFKTTEDMGLNLQLPGGGKAFIYEKENHEPATYTVLNIVVADLEAAVDDLSTQGVSFEHYDGMHQDKKGIARPPKPEYGQPIAWFKDPAGNILSLIEG